MNVYKIASNDFEYVLREIYARLIKRNIIKFLSKSNDPEFIEIVDYLNEYGISVFPYKYKFDYSISDIKAQKDLKYNLIYIENDKGFCIFLNRKYKNIFRAKRYFNNILIEQDIRSPHCYVNESFKPEFGDIVLDIGGAEGYFTVECLDVIKKSYVFECDPRWQEALNITFKDYSDKVQIVPKYVSNIDNDNNISLDRFIVQNNLASESLFIKIDAEGYEIKILDGFIKSLKTLKKFNIVICSYHTSDAEREIRKYFENYDISTSEGYMLYYYDYKFDKPYLRKGVIRVSKK